LPLDPGIGGRGHPTQNDASMDWICRLTHSTHSSHRTYSTYRTISPIQEESYSYNVCWIPHIPRLPQINFIDGGVYGGEVKKYIILFFVGEVPFPSHT